jgi:hypothetical protein
MTVRPSSEGSGSWVVKDESDVAGSSEVSPAAETRVTSAAGGGVRTAVAIAESFAEQRGQLSARPGASKPQAEQIIAGMLEFYLHPATTA